MKKILLIISILFTTVTFGQNCNFTYSTAGALNVIAFQANATFPPPAFRYVWSFGDGTMSSDSAPVHAYNGFGTFIACYDIYDLSQTLVCSACDSVVIGNPGGGGCSFIATIDTSNNQVVFTAQPSGAFSTIHWDFGNGDTAVGPVATYTYLAPGVYTVCMTETDNFLGTTVCIFCSTIVIGSTTGGTCSFTATVDSTNLSLVYFSANVSTGSSVTWSFGDNTTGTGLTVSHVYNGVGPYYVCITASPDSFITVCTYCDWVTLGNPTGGCSFTYRADSANTNLIYFVAFPSSTGSGITWDFGDGSTGVGNLPTHLYAATGTYTVCMTEHNFSGAVICTYCFTITVGGGVFSCQAYFYAASLGLTGYFLDLSNANPSSTSYYWDFGDGDTSSLRFPQHTYALPGTYNVCLSIADPLNAGCSSQYCTPVTVDTVVNAPTGCQAFFVTLQMAPYQFVVVNLSSGVNLSFNWDFGDGSSSQLAYPSHTYVSTGSYNLCLTVSSGPACTSTYCDTLSVDSLGNVFRSLTAFTINVMSPAQLIGVKENSTPGSFAVYPNPVRSVLTVSLASDIKGTSLYKVYAIDGTEVSGGSFTKGENRLSVSNWKPGVYILEVSDAKGYRTYQKIIKE